MKLPYVYPCANMTNLEWMAGQVAMGSITSQTGLNGMSPTGRKLLVEWVVSMAQEILVEVQRVERELPDLGD